ncbi:disease resistance protein RPM1-like [Panicum miliaceum]|uniref:Disease resistance protein RPM1-like n=1 Tax=Panicum miliaceum TaxID=4540 RepID=A0A3L6PDL1_PANMI|nr:disease resistance protein RPM1-like [Panicum miliaceum]
MADALFVILRKIALSLGEGVLERIGTELAEVAPILTDFEHSMKQIEGELSILKAFIDKVSIHKDGDKAFDAWLDQVRDVAHEVEDIIDEYAYLTAQNPDTSSFFKRKFHQIKNFAAWQKFPSQISQVEGRIQRLTEMRNRYGISVGEIDKGDKLQQHNKFSMSDFAYLTDNSEIVGNIDETTRLTQWLLEEKQDRTLIAIFGMGGLGKTTITSSVYNNKRIRRTFDCRAWVTLSQTYQGEELLREIINQLIDQRSSMASGLTTMSRMKLLEVIQIYLRDKKYIIVLDDIWDKDAWLFLNYAFVRNNCGSKVLITTRQKDVSSLAADIYVIELKTLKYAESWELFCKKAFHASTDNKCPENLISWANKIVTKCQGLPLAIVTIGSILSYHELEEQVWKFFYNHLSWHIENNPELNWISSVLNLTLNNLPSYLRSCFLYCSLYPEDYKIKRKLISKLWIAGLVEERGDGTTMEEVALCYLMELTQRSLLQVTERNACGRARTFAMHDLVRKVTSIIAKREKFGIAYGDAGMTQVVHEARLLSIQRGAKSLNSLASSRLRSFILFDTEIPSSWIYDISSSFRLPRVGFASIEQVPCVVTELYNLRYLDFSHTKVKEVPASFSKLVNLQVLDLRFSCVEELPLEISMLTNLRHLHQSYIEELWNSLTKMPNLSRLLLFASDMDEILNLKMLRPLPNLKLLWLAGKLDGGIVPSLFSKFEKLTQLKMDWSGLKEDPISSLSHMLSLVNLCLSGAYDGEQLTFCAGWFPKLRSLQLVDMEHLNLIEIEDGTLMSLHTLELTGLRNLKAVPEGIKYIRTLDQMFLTDMSNEFIERLLGSDHHIVQHIPDIRNFGSSDTQEANNFISLEYLAKKYGTGALKYSPAE